MQDVIHAELGGGGTIGAGCNLHSVRLVLRKVNLDYGLGTFKVKTRSDLTLSLFSLSLLSEKGKKRKTHF